MEREKKQLTTEDFTQNEAVQKCLKELAETFHDKPFIVSDVIDNDGHQYVNLVQKGGGVLGIALVGYTYILEQMNIRFIRMAGASAGAINTALMTVTGKKEDAKSAFVLDAICKLDFFNLVDGHPVMRWIIKHFITNKNFTEKIKKLILRAVLTLFILLAGDFIFLGLQHTFPAFSYLTKIFFIFTSLLLVSMVIFFSYAATLSTRLKNSGLGINPGDYFYDWIKKQLIDNGVETVTQLNLKASEPIPGLHLRVPNPQGFKGLEGDVTFITSELVTENKIQFPQMWNLFRKNIDELQPAGFIRSSMSIPVFFESYFINHIPNEDEEIKQIWLKTFDEPNPPSTARFVDGGILSNFPINIFFDPEMQIPQLPSFGIDLNDSKPGDEGTHAESWSLGGYFGRMLNTVKGYYDKDFLLKNRIFRKGIGVIPLAGFNWLNFFLTDDDKIKMFVLGAQAATEFLKKFNWEEYKSKHNDGMTELQATMPAQVVK